MEGNLIFKHFEKQYTNKKNTTLNICNTIIHPGESVNIGLQLPEILGFAQLYMPLKVKAGKKAGPRIVLFGTIHGDEFNALEIINRLMNLSLLNKLRGTIISVPAVNIFGLLNRQRAMPDSKELSNLFPGDENGSYTERVAYLFTNEIFSKADICIDIQSGFPGYYNIPQIYTDTSIPINRELARLFRTPVVSNVNYEEGSSYGYAKENDIPLLTYQGGEAIRFDKKVIEQGIKGIVNIIRGIGMLPPTKAKNPTSKTWSPFLTENNHWIFSPSSGIVHSMKKLGEEILKGETIATITEPLGNNERIPIKSEVTGVIVGYNNVPLVYEGEALYKIAQFKEGTEEVVETIQGIHTL